MPLANHFRHQQYTSAPPTSPHHLLAAPSCPRAGSKDFTSRMRAVGRAYRRAGVSAIYLVHGTFVGPDALGMLSDLSRLFPAASAVMNRLSKEVVDRFAGDAGNYTGEYAEQFEAAINDAADTQIPVRRFFWSSQNNHIGRADGAVRLIDELASADLPPGGRVLLWGHSHAGNVFSLVTNLLAASPDARNQFFDAARVYFRWPVLGWIDIPLWRHVEMLLAEGDPLREHPLDFVTFGTPIRYGWDSNGYSRLLHFVYHRPGAGRPKHCAPFPPETERICRAADGDYVQQLGIAGTNVMPSIFSWRSWLADRRLNSVLQAEVASGNTLDHFAAGRRVADDGTTLLVDYGPTDVPLAEHVAGHAIYTRPEWMLFHAEEIARRFYQEAVARNPASGAA